jgi:hypothetical protein
MSRVPSELRDEIPSFEDEGRPREHGPIDFTGLTSVRTAKGWREVVPIAALAVALFFGAELLLRATDTPTYVVPRPIDVVQTLAADFGSLYAGQLWVTMQ